MREGRSPLSAILETAGRPRRPDFIGIGSEKCGTTWLWDRLREHPAIGVPAPKELRFFAARYLGTQPVSNATRALLNGPPRPLGVRQAEALRNELRVLNLTDDSYLRVFGSYSERQVVGEVSPMYCVLPPEGVAHMRRLCGDSRIILLMRDPVQRMISGAKMKAAEAAAEKGEALTEALIARHLEAPIQERLSRYSAMIALYRRHWPEDRILFGFIDEIREDPRALMDRIFSFLGVGPAPEGALDYEARSNEGRSFKVSAELEAAVYGRLRDEYDALAELFPERVAGWRARYEG